MTSIVRWDPFRNLRRDMTRLLWDLSPARANRDEAPLGLWSPAIDVYEKDGSVVLTAELPGVEAKDVQLSVENDVLTLSGERKLDREVKEDAFHWREIAQGSFSRSFTLPSRIDRDKIAASFKDGVLTVTVPLAAEARPKQIEIQTAA